MVGIVLGVAAWGVGCAGPKAATAPAPKAVAEVKLVPAEAAPAKITLVNATYQFVVLEFAQRPIPGIGTQLTVWRGEQKVGVVRITEPIRSPRFATADILEGELRLGDEAK